MFCNLMVRSGAFPIFDPEKLLIVTAFVWASLAAGDRVVLLNPVNVLITPYLKANRDLPKYVKNQMLRAITADVERIQSFSNRFSGGQGC